MSQDTNPQEWTLRRVMAYFEAGSAGTLKLVQDINAALAAERENVRMLERALFDERERNNIRQ
jgi:hypothetical protein